MPSKSPINSKKHYVQTTLSSVANGSIVNVTVAHAIEGASSSPEHCVEGSVIKAIYCEYWLTQASQNVGSFTAGVYKDPGGSNPMLSADAAALQDYDNKKNVLYTTQGLSPSNAVAIMPILKFWVKIPKGKQRMGLGDKLKVFIRNNNGTDDINYCGFTTYKSYN